MTRTFPHSCQLTTDPNLQPWFVEWHQSLPSTMDRAKEIARTSVSAGHVVVADFQTQGRGTRGRTWVAPAGSCLMFSFVIRPLLDISELATLPAAIAGLVRDGLNEHYASNAALDPPNDLTINGRKLAGVLCQSHVRGKDIEWVICGIGLNTNLTEAQRSVPDSTSLFIEYGGVYPHDELLAHLLSSLDPVRGG